MPTRKTPRTTAHVQGGFALPAAFWRAFVDDTWSRRPTVLRRPFAAPIATPDELFAGLVACAERERRGDRTLVRFYIGPAMQQGDVAPCLPLAADGSIEGYLARMHRQLGGREFGLVVNDYHVHDAGAYLRLRDFLRGFYERVGLPAVPATASVFLGTYAKTPFGVHTDPESVFTFVIAGKKRIRTWPAERFDARSPVRFSLDYGDHLKGSRVLDGRPGDLFFWPAGTWHVGESVGEPALTLSVGIHVEGRSEYDVLKPLLQALRARLHTEDLERALTTRPGRTQSALSALPRRVASVRRALAAAARDERLEHAISAAVLDHLTASGFHRAPAPRPLESLRDDDVVAGNSLHRIAWIGAPGGELCCSANGLSLYVTDHPKVRSLLARLNKGTRARVGALLERYSGVATVRRKKHEATREDLRTLLEMLLSHRAIERVG